MIIINSNYVRGTNMDKTKDEHGTNLVQITSVTKDMWIANGRVFATDYAFFREWGTARSY